MIWTANWKRFSLVIYLNSWAIPFYVDRLPGATGWTYRLGFLCFYIHFRTQSHTNYEDSYYDDVQNRDWLEDDLPF